MSDVPPLPLMTRLRIAAKGLLLGLLIGGVGAGYLYFQMNTQRVALLQVIDDAKVALSEADSKATQAQTTFDAKRATLDAQLNLYRAVDAIRDQNFGSARDLIKTVREKNSESTSPNPAVSNGIANITIAPENAEASIASIQAVQSLLIGVSGD